MDLNNRLTEDETLEQAYDIFLELAGGQPGSGGHHSVQPAI